MKAATTAAMVLVIAGGMLLSAETNSVYPPLTHQHLAAMSDARLGISEFARGTARENKRFCVEDTARALVAILKIHTLAPTDDTARLARRYVDAISGLQKDDGRFHFGYDQEGNAISIPAKGDQTGRVLWGLGHATTHGIDRAMRLRTGEMFLRLLPHLDLAARGPMPPSYAIQGLHLFLKARPDTPEADQALRACTDHLLSRMPKDPDDSWHWPDDVVTYDSARLPLALLLASETTGDIRCRDAGLRVLAFLAKVNFPDDGSRLHVIGNRGWYRRGTLPARFDQQPIDASSWVEASVAAWRVTKDEAWKIRARIAFSWFTGNNTNGAAMYDAGSGGCRDGLGPDYVNQNQGAESTISYLIARCEMESLAIQPAPGRNRRQRAEP